jgi:hypothetical protein
LDVVPTAQRSLQVFDREWNGRGEERGNERMSEGWYLEVWEAKDEDYLINPVFLRAIMLTLRTSETIRNMVSAETVGSGVCLVFGTSF